MSWSDLELDERMETAVERLEAAVATYKAIGEQAAVAKNRAKLEEAKAMLQTIGSPDLKTAELRKAWVTTQVADLQLKADIAEHHTSAERESIRALASECDLMRTMKASHRAMTNSGGWG